MMCRRGNIITRRDIVEQLKVIQSATNECVYYNNNVSTRRKRHNVNSEINAQLSKNRRPRSIILHYKCII